MTSWLFSPPRKPAVVVAVVPTLSKVAQKNVRDYADVLYVATASGLSHMNPKYPMSSNKRILTEMVVYALLRDGDSELDRSWMTATLRGYWCALPFDVPNVSKRVAMSRVRRGVYRFTKEYGVCVKYGEGPRRREVVIVRYAPGGLPDGECVYHGTPYHRDTTPISKYLTGCEEGHFRCKDAAVLEVLEYIA